MAARAGQRGGGVGDVASSGSQQLRTREDCHLAVQSKCGQRVFGVAVSNQAIEETGSTNGSQERKHRIAVERRDQVSLKDLEQARLSVSFVHSIVKLHGHIGFADNLVRGKNLGASLDQRPQRLQARRMHLRRVPCKQAHKDRGVDSELRCGSACRGTPGCQRARRLGQSCPSMGPTSNGRCAHSPRQPRPCHARIRHPFHIARKCHPAPVQSRR